MYEKHSSCATYLLKTDFDKCSGIPTAFQERLVAHIVQQHM